jgi:hypothetical protein
LEGKQLNYVTTQVDGSLCSFSPALSLAGDRPFSGDYPFPRLSLNPNKDWTNIDMNINSLPIAAIGIGIGIDYGYYVLSRITEEYEHFPDVDQAIEEALMTTG